MRILWILPYLPWPTTNGGKTRQYHLLRTLAARGHRITLLVQSKQPLDDATRSRLEPLLERLIVFRRRPLRHPLGLAAVALGPWPMLTAVNGVAPLLRRSFEELLRETWDVIQLEHSYTCQPYLQPLLHTGRPFLLTEHNLESGLGAATYDRLPGWLSAGFSGYDRWRARRWERRVFDTAARIVAVTEEDAVEMRSITRTPVDVVVNGVDTRAFADVVPERHSRRVLFIGNYEYAPNVDAVHWALDEILPRVWREHPEARFAVAGYALPAEWARRWNDSRIEWLGYVPDLPRLQSESALFFAPLRHGGGSKLKVLEALAAGLPLVTTSQGGSGLALRPGEDHLRAEDADGLATAVCRLLAEPEQASEIGRRGRAYAVAHHDWESCADQLEAAYRRMSARAPMEAAACA